MTASFGGAWLRACKGFTAAVACRRLAVNTSLYARAPRPCGARSATGYRHGESWTLVQHLLEESGSVRFAVIHCFAALSSHRPAPSGGEYRSKSVRGMDAALERTRTYSQRVPAAAKTTTAFANAQNLNTHHRAARGIHNPAAEMMSRCTSFAPPPKVRIEHVR